MSSINCRCMESILVSSQRFPPSPSSSPCSLFPTAFSNGKLPSNSQIDIALSSFTAHEKLRNPNQKLSEEGRGILEDFQVVVEEAKRLLLIKNYDQALQEFIWHATQLGQKGVDMEVPDAPIDKETAKSHAQEGVAGLKTLGQLILSNG